MVEMMGRLKSRAVLTMRDSCNGCGTGSGTSDDSLLMSATIVTSFHFRATHAKLTIPVYLFQSPREAAL